FEQSKREREIRKNQKVITIKEVRLSATIEDHDVDVKFKNAVKFLKEGNKVKVTIRFRGRQITHSEIGREVMKDFAERIKDVGIVERAPLIEGRNMTMIISPRESN
ncbi:MAG TPA: translation initiation factor IF-3, partial [Candidatus Pullichristensenella excrementigallinarum]|nr:translation initiation factor IF-3 [Candidatus Pullichristensenella excrementigallinarum]